MASAPYAAGGNIPFNIPFNPYAFPQRSHGGHPYPYPPGLNSVSAPPYIPAPKVRPMPVTAPQIHNPYGPVDRGARPLHVRKEKSLTFTNVAAANDWDSSRVPVSPASRGATGNKGFATYNAPSSHRVLLKDRRAASDNRSMYSAPSTVTSVADTQTAYVNMLMALGHIHWLYDVYAYTFCWLLLAGFVVMPQTLTKTLPDFIDKVGIADDELKNALKRMTNQVGLFYVASGVSGVGLLGMLILWFQWRGNYIWIMQKIFLPGCFDALAGSISTLISIFLLNKGKWDTLSIVTLSVVGGVTVANALLAGICLLLIARLRKKHKKVVGKHSAGKAGRGRYRGFMA